MLKPKYIPLVLKQVFRNRTRSLLTIGGVATAMFLFGAIEAMQSAMREATQASAQEVKLIVYRENRFCPFTSRLPERYFDRITSIPGVKAVEPARIFVSNCRTSLDVVTFRGVRPELFAKAHSDQLSVVEGSMDDWTRRTDAALLGETLAKRRGLKVGQSFNTNGITVTVAGIIASDEAQDKNVAYVHLDFLQRAPGVKQTGIVTQFNVRVDDPSKMKAVAEKIDSEFKNDEAPTTTRSETAFAARAAGDLFELISFTRWLGLGCVAAVLGLVGNTIILSVQDRVREHAVFQTLGFTRGLIARLIVAEGFVLSVCGGIAGTAAAYCVLRFGHFSLTSEGLSINFEARPDLWVGGLLVSILLGILAGLVPAWQASRRQIVESFRAV